MNGTLLMRANPATMRCLWRARTRKKNNRRFKKNLQFNDYLHAGEGKTPCARRFNILFSLILVVFQFGLVSVPKTAFVSIKNIKFKC